MSSHFLHILPDHPQFIPSLDQQQVAVAALKRFAPDADLVEAVVTDDVQFVDPGGNFERVLCPNCDSDITGWWIDAMDVAYVTRFERLTITLACCGATTSLNDLRYEWPAGFARFRLTARNANIGGWLSSGQIAELQALLGCNVKQILAHL